MNSSANLGSLEATSGLRRWHRPPLIGLAALAFVLLALPLTHSLSMLARTLSAQLGTFWAYVPIGLLGLVLLVVAVRSQRESVGTILGFVCGLLLWTGWAAFAFRANDVSLGLPMAILDERTRWPNNLLYIEGSVGICLVVLLFFVLNRDTRCNAFLWLQRRFHLRLGTPDSAQGRNIGRIVFAETVFVTWFFYGFSLLLADPRVIGFGNRWHYFVTALLAAWGLYLLWRLCKLTRIMAAIRYAIPVKAVLWIVFGETLPRYGWYEEVWLKPLEYPRTMAVVLGVFLATLAVSALMPKRRTDHLRR